MFLGGAAFPRLLLGDGASLVGAAVQSFFGVVPLFPLGWCCLLHPICSQSEVTQRNAKKK